MPKSNSFDIRDINYSQNKSHKWPEAESNCRPLVFQIWANLLTLANNNYIRSLYRANISQLACNKTDFKSECFTVFRLDSVLLVPLVN